MSEGWIPGETILKFIDNGPGEPIPMRRPYIFLGLREDINSARVVDAQGKVFNFGTALMCPYESHMLSDETINTLRQVAIQCSLGLMSYSEAKATALKRHFIVLNDLLLFPDVNGDGNHE